MTHVELIYCASGDRAFVAIAQAAGFRIGSQLPTTTRAPLYFADQNWKQPNRERYMAALAQHRPTLATVLDWERDEQRAEVLSWAEEAAQYCERVLIVPKVQGGIDRLPRSIGGAAVVLAFSVPTSFGGTQVPIWEFAGWPVHLLGGAPHVQRHYYQHLSAIANVVSADGNMANKMAQNCRFWSQQTGVKGHWRGLNEIGLETWGKDSNYEAFRRSCQNTMAMWEECQ